MSLYSFSSCLAHPPNERLTDHLLFVAKGIEVLIGGSGCPYRDAAILTGLLHDVGKGTQWFQKRLTGEIKGKPLESHHSELSAVIAWKVSEGLNISDESEKNRQRLSLFLSILKHHSNLNES
ncbi:hypothetical protein ES705_46497 [subsurface metagenome]